MTNAIGRRLLAIVLILIGLVVTIGGAYLATLGGSLYYLVAGIIVALAGVLTWRGDERGPLLYAAYLVATLLWALWEAGLDGWALAPRLIAPAALGILFVFPWFRKAMRPRPALAPVAAGALSLLTILIVSLLPAQYGATTERPTIPVTVAGTAGEWPTWGRTPGGDRFSPLTQITPANVADLKPAWTYHAGTIGRWQKSSFQATPLMVGDSLYLCAPTNIIIALDPETGKERWRFDPRVDQTGNSVVTACRGVAYYRAAGAPDCPERIISATFDSRLVALDARTGRPCPSFGTNGFVDLKTGLGESPPGFYYVSSAPTIVRGNVVLGGWVADNQSIDEPSGVIRGYDAVTGKFAWAWDMGRPGVTTEPKPGEQYTRSTPNSWAPMSGDEQLGLVYVPTGNPTPDHWGGARSVASERFGSALVALDASTGLPRWAFQTTHHDLWDYDLAAQPTLFNLTVAGQNVPAVAQATKTGEIFVLDRRTGKPLLPIVERPVPQRGTVEPARLAKTQPFSVGMPSFGGARLTERDMWGISPLDQLWCRIEFRKLRYDGPYTPPGTDRSLIYPSIGGGLNWGSVSVDPSRNVMIVNSMYYPSVFELLPRAETDRILDNPGGYSHNFALPQRQAGAPYGVRLTGLVSPLDVPCNEPPYGKISAIDLTTRKVLWSRPFGMARDTGPLGLTSGLPLPMGMPNFGGSVMTASGLTFIGATQDTTFRAFNTSTGKLLWQSRLPAGGQANPMTYISPRSGRQFVLIVAGGHMLARSPLGDAVVAYALPPRR